MNEFEQVRKKDADLLVKSGAPQGVKRHTSFPRVILPFDPVCKIVQDMDTSPGNESNKNQSY